MSNVIRPEQIEEVVAFLSEKMNGFREELAELDSRTGDGDLGVTIALIFRAMSKSARGLKTASISESFQELGEEVADTAPSTFGTLVACMLEGFGKEAGNAEVLNAELYARGLKAAACGVMKKGKAKPGDKTLLDALCPAAEAAEKALKEQDDLAYVARAAYQAARDGAEKTVEMKAMTGRAGYMGERTIGNKDPGAEAIAKMLGVYAEYLG